MRFYFVFNNNNARVSHRLWCLRRGLFISRLFLSDDFFTWQLYRVSLESWTFVEGYVRIRATILRDALGIRWNEAIRQSVSRNDSILRGFSLDLIRVIMCFTLCDYPHFRCLSLQLGRLKRLYSSFNAPRHLRIYFLPSLTAIDSVSEHIHVTSSSASLFWKLRQPGFENALIFEASEFFLKVLIFGNRYHTRAYFKNTFVKIDFGSISLLVYKALF